MTMPESYRRAATICCYFFLSLFIFYSFITFIGPKIPTTKIISATVHGVSPRLQVPPLKVELNITLTLQILLRNPNKQSLKLVDHNTANYYQLRLATTHHISPATIPAHGSKTIAAQLTLEANSFMPSIDDLLEDVLAGEMVVFTETKVRGKLKYLKIFHKHFSSSSFCEIVIGFSDLKIRQLECSYDYLRYTWFN